MSERRRTLWHGGWRVGRVLLGAFLAAVVFRGCIAEPFRIPTASMAQTLLVNDYVLVTKFEYGARLPITLGLPLTDVYYGGFELPYVRLPGLRSPRRGDVAVFNYPLGAEPVDRRQPYVKRIVALPGDTVALVQKQLVVNGEHVALPGTAQQRWRVRLRPGAAVPPLLQDRVRSQGGTHPKGLLLLEATSAFANRLRRLPEVQSVVPDVQPRRRLSPALFPGTPGYTRDDFGPLRAPQRGDTLHLTPESWPIYRDLLRRYERRSIRAQGDSYSVDGVPTRVVVVRQDYYFTLGDNRDNSEDSRTWGFVPVDHLIGRARWVYYSWDEEAALVRWSRMMRFIL